MPRFPGSSRNSLQTLRQLCENETFERILILTTFWDAVSSEVGHARERELQDTQTLLKDLLDRGATMRRMPQTAQSRVELLNGLDWRKSYKSQLRINVANTETPPAQDDAFERIMERLKLGASPGLSKHETSMNALSRLIASQEDAFARRESAYQAREARLREHEAEATAREQKLRSEFEQRFKGQQDSFDAALNAERARTKELEDMIDQVRDTQFANQKLQLSKDEEIDRLRKSRTKLVTQTQSAQQALIFGIFTDMSKLPNREWMA